MHKWIALRGERLPQDRLNAGMYAFWVVVPFFMLLQGWGLQCDNCSTAVGGLALPIVTSFFTAAGLLAAFASLNTYCAGTYSSLSVSQKTDKTSEAIPKKRREIIAGKYMVQYTFSAFASASAVPLIDAVGTGPAGTIGTLIIQGHSDHLVNVCRCDTGSTCWTLDLCYCQTGAVDAGVGGGEIRLEVGEAVCYIDAHDTHNVGFSHLPTHLHPICLASRASAMGRNLDYRCR